MRAPRNPAVGLPPLAHNLLRSPAKAFPHGILFRNEALPVPYRSQQEDNQAALAALKAGGVMIRQRTSNLLFQYWDVVRGGRVAPNRYEIEPSKIAALLPETFIVETDASADYRIRLAGTRICDQFGRELRGCSLLEFWDAGDREGLSSAVANVMNDGAVAVILISGAHTDGRRADFEMTLMPLIHAGTAINRILGCLTAINPPMWLGTDILRDFAIAQIELMWPDGQPLALAHSSNDALPAPAVRQFDGEIVSDARRRFRVLQGGLSRVSE